MSCVSRVCPVCVQSVSCVSRESVSCVSRVCPKCVQSVSRVCPVPVERLTFSVPPRPLCVSTTEFTVDRNRRRDWTISNGFVTGAGSRYTTRRQRGGKAVRWTKVD
ncbi:hypothetical protein NL108_015844 [Boleophthalmus pectinirostris]|nr:hypothetical protein NL108_015844 [Boleophthalmus pectinirostris]